MGKLKDDSNFQIYGWMATKLKLKGNELLIYAIIYSFSRNDNGNGVFNASTAYLCEWTGLTRGNVINCISKLLDKNLIIKLEDNSTKRKPNVYSINKSILNKASAETVQELVPKQYKASAETVQELVPKQYKASAETVQELVPKQYKASAETVHNNNIINTKDNTIINTTTTAAENNLEDICKLYLREISNKSCCSPLETDKLSKLISEYGADEVKEAIEIAVMRNRRSLAYIEGILKNTGGDENGSQKEKAAVVRRGKATGRGGLYKSRKVETVEDVERKFEHETSGWD